MPITVPPKIQRSQVNYDFSSVHAWLSRHQQEYVGKWIVLDGDRLIGAGKDPRPFVQSGSRGGCKDAFCQIHP